MRSRSTPIAVILLLGALVAGCGGGNSDSGSDGKPQVNIHDFPAAHGKTLTQLVQNLRAGGPVLAPSVSELTPGRNRFGFGLFDVSRRQISNAPAVVYVAPAGGGPARGPFKARYESLAVKPQFQSQTVARDPDAAKTVYVADVDFPKPGKYDVVGMARLDGRLVAATSAGGPVVVTGKSRTPAVGDPAPRIHTPTAADVHGDLSQIDTRQPHDDMHNVDFADVVGKKPVVLVFATPLLCQSRVCGPVVDLAEQVKAERSKDADFIHMEIYKDNTVDKGFRPQVLAWGLRTEPWLFVVNREGRIAARLEGAFSADELNAAIDKAVK